MRPDELDARMRSLEVYHSLRLPRGAWIVLRVDGRGFSRLTKTRFEKPFDPAFHEGMVQSAEALLEECQGLYAFTESDEISLLLPRAWDLYDRELEKAVSLSAGLASAAFSLASGVRGHFDGRALPCGTDDQIVDYFRWRQADAARCALNGWCYWTLRKSGRSVTEITAKLAGQGVAFKNELLFQAGINFKDVPAWQRRGTGLYREGFQREGYDPKRGQSVVVTRRRVKVDRDLPMGEDYAGLIRRLLAASAGAGAAGGENEPVDRVVS
jgi:tRNA(His) 5'-end guanylyltransferase